MPRDNTSAAERQRFIMNWLTDRPSIAVGDIAERFGVSDVTARHDLDTLESSGRVRRVRGGAVSRGRAIALSYPEERARINADAKEAIGRAAAGFVSDGDVVIADIGTTSFSFVQQLTDKRDITIITGDLAIANYVNYNLPSADVLLLGGILRKGHLYTAGSLTLDSMSKLYADKAFVGADGFHPDRGFTVKHDFSVSIKQRYLANARQRFMLLDASKLGTTSFFQFASLSDFDVLVMNGDPQGEMGRAISEAHDGPELVLAQA